MMEKDVPNSLFSPITLSKVNELCQFYLPFSEKEEKLWSEPTKGGDPLIMPDINRENIAKTVSQTER